MLVCCGQPYRQSLLLAITVTKKTPKTTDKQVSLVAEGIVSCPQDAAADTYLEGDAVVTAIDEDSAGSWCSIHVIHSVLKQVNAFARHFFSS